MMWFKKKKLPRPSSLGLPPKAPSSEDRVLEEFKELKNIIYDLVKDVQACNEDIETLKNPKVKGGVGMSYLEKMDKDIALLKKTKKDDSSVQEQYKELKAALKEELKFKDTQVKELEEKIFGLENVFDIYREKSISKKDLDVMNKKISDLNKSVVELNNHLAKVEKDVDVNTKKLDKVDVKMLQAAVKSLHNVIAKLLKKK